MIKYKVKESKVYKVVPTALKIHKVIIPLLGVMFAELCPGRLLKKAPAVSMDFVDFMDF